MLAESQVLDPAGELGLLVDQARGGAFFKVNSRVLPEPFTTTSPASLTGRGVGLEVCPEGVLPILLRLLLRQRIAG